MAAIRVKGELQDYYQCTVKEGENKMLVLNAMRNKPPGGPVIQRFYALGNGGEKYDKNYAAALV